jgi:hypothetical protein
MSEFSDAETVVFLQAHIEHLERERDEARARAREYYFDVQQLAGEYQWNKHWAGDVDDYPWLKE